jgi:hypothetical protein
MQEKRAGWVWIEKGTIIRIEESIELDEFTEVREDGALLICSHS